MAQTLGVDIGGTFTDFVLFDDTGGEVTVWKNATTPGNPIEGVLTGLQKVPALDQVRILRLGMTTATNALLERKGARVAYVTTKGFKDIPFIQRGNRRAHYDLSWIKAKPLMRREDCFEVDERLDAQGAVIKAVDPEEVERLAHRLEQAGIESVAINCLFSYVSPVHERQIRDGIARVLPDMPVSISFDVLPKWKEYERATTTIADAFLKPIIRRGFAAMREAFGRTGIGERVVVIKSNGGETTLDAAAETPVELAVSGPTGGVVAARALARQLHIDNLVTLDMGGTSTDCSTVVNGDAIFTTDFEIEWGVPIQVPMIDIRTIGAGGGSIAWIDKGGMLRVGPHSAGAAPGPACYGLGGQEPTVTDANVVLGRISPDNFLGGAMRLDMNAAMRAVASVADRMGLSRDQAALAIVQIANNNMVGALRTVLLEKGLDPREFRLLAFGGAGPLHAADLMAQANIPHALIPPHPGQFSAFGFTMTDARVDRHRTVQQISDKFDRERVSTVLQELVEESRVVLVGQRDTGPLVIQRMLEMRYLGQNYELELDFDHDEFTAANTNELWERFHAQHDARFGFAIPGERIELVNIKVAITVRSNKPDLPALPRGDGRVKPVHSRRVVFESGDENAQVFDRATLRAGDVIRGPALVEEFASVTVVRPGQTLSVGIYGTMEITE